MALIECPECKKQISDKARACIHCGYPIPKIKPQNEHIEQHPLEDAKLDPSTQPQNQVAEIRSAPEKQSLKPPMDSQTKKKITISVVAILILFVTVWLIAVAVENKASRERDLSNVFDVSFDMTMEDIIEYEAEMYANGNYEFDSEYNRLDFIYEECKHRYFFDEETSLLTSFHYSAIYTVFNAECEHVAPLKRKLLKEIGEWDENPANGVRKVAYGKIDGVPCKVLYFDGATPEIGIYKDDSK